MATVNFSVPNDVKEAFDNTFGVENKSAVIARLMRLAVQERQLQVHREQLFRRLTRDRSRRGAADASSVREARRAGRS